MTEQPQPGPEQQPWSNRPTPPSTPPPPARRLTRTSWDAPISGICGGVARYFGLDPTLVRVLTVIAAVFTFPVGPIVYLILWAVIPKE